MKIVYWKPTFVAEKPCKENAEWKCYWCFLRTSRLLNLTYINSSAHVSSSLQLNDLRLHDRQTERTVHIHHWICRQHANIQRRIQKNRSPAEKEKKRPPQGEYSQVLVLVSSRNTYLFWNQDTINVLSLVFWRKQNAQSNKYLSIGSEKET